jgi:hypothetical protein
VQSVGEHSTQLEIACRGKGPESAKGNLRAESFESDLIFFIYFFLYSQYEYDHKSPRLVLLPALSASPLPFLLPFGLCPHPQESQQLFL